MTFPFFQTNLKKISSLADIKAGIPVDCFFNQSLLDPVDLRILLCHVLKLSHAQLILHAKNKLNETQTEMVLDLLKRRLNGEPIAYIVGKREFYGLSLVVSPDVLIPRPETELLVDLAIDFLPENAHFLDLGTGSGAIAISIASKRKDISYFQELLP